MPLDDETRARLNPIHQRLALASQELDLLLTAPDAGLPAERRVDLLWNVFGEVSNYDRHYSTVRSALTILLVSVGLAVASEPLKALFAIVRAQDNPFCLQHGASELVTHGVLPFVPMLLIFALAIAINIHFQRLTASCEILEDEIERKIIELSPGLGEPGVQNPKAAGVSGYRFRRDLETIYRRTRRRHPEPMKILLIVGILVFILFVAAAAVLPCVWHPVPSNLGVSQTAPPATGGAATSTTKP